MYGNLMMEHGMGWSGECEPVIMRVDVTFAGDIRTGSSKARSVTEVKKNGSQTHHEDLEAVHPGV